MILRWMKVLGLIAAVFGAANYAPLLKTYPEQDACAFGPVSNEQYRSYLSEVKVRQRTTWPAFTASAQEIERQLNYRLSDVIGSETNTYARIAAMHAILRALGAQFLNANGRRDEEPFNAAPPYHRSTVFNYQVDINRLAFQPYPRQLWLRAVLTVPGAVRDKTSIRPRLEYFFANLVSFMDTAPDAALTSFGENCPPVPSADAAIRYEKLETQGKNGASVKN